METQIIHDVIIALIAAAVIAYAAYRLRQPVIMGYIIAGIAIGPHLGLKWVTNPEAINFTSELGLIALLFMVGLELDLRKIASSGKLILIAAIAQFVICVAMGLAFFSIGGYNNGNNLAIYYLAITFSFSSTMIVVKLLYDKFELDTLPGRITLGILVLQDIWAILFLAIQPNLADPQLGPLALSLAKGVGLVVGCLLIRRFLLPSVFKSIAKNPELLVVTSLGWCFLIAYLSGDVAGLSRAMGALIAGVSLSTLPYKEEIATRVTSIRSFFLILFFVSLGMQVTQPSVNTFVMSLLASVFLIASRFVSLSALLYFMKKGIRVSFLVPLNLAQISEFSLVIVAIGVDYGHIDKTVMTIILFTLMITATVSTYMITYSHQLYLFTDRILKKLRIKDMLPTVEEGRGEAEVSNPVLFLGFYKIASSLLHSLENKNPEIKQKITVVDFNPEVYQKLNQRGVRGLFGDLTNTNTLTDSGIEKAKVVVSTIPDTILKGTSNLSLLKYTKRINPDARVVVTAENVQSARELWSAGADYVVLPHFAAADTLAPVLQDLLTEETLPAACEECRLWILEHEGDVIE